MKLNVYGWNWKNNYLRKWLKKNSNLKNEVQVWKQKPNKIKRPRMKSKIKSN
jgi:hypothetical protein